MFLILRKYNPLYSIEYYEPVEESLKGVEFDRGQGGIALLNPNFNSNRTLFAENLMQLKQYDDAFNFE